jgi:hypothetical protein
LLIIYIKKNSASKFHAPDTLEHNTWPADPTILKKHQFSVMCPDALFVWFALGAT